jgi:cell division protein FtsN
MPSSPVETKETFAPAETDREVKGIEKKIISDGQGKISTEKYFVIVGSFREPANARKRQFELEKEGFRSEILKTEEGLYRISVLATDDANEARSEVRRIWLMYPQYSDTWMLISKEK